MATSPDTAQQIVTGVRVNLRRPSDIKLPDDDILEKINDLCREYVEEESLSINEHRTTIAPLTITVPDVSTNPDFDISDFEVPDFKPHKLEYANLLGETFNWQEITIVPFETWARHYSQGRIVASFYGSSETTTPSKVKLSFLDTQLADLQFRLSYRLPLLTIIQMGDKPPIPSGHMPMLKLEASILCAPLVRDDSMEWIAWMERTLPLYVTKLQNLKKNWRDYLESSVEPQIQPIARSDRANRNLNRPVRPLVPTQ